MGTKTWCSICILYLMNPHYSLANWPLNFKLVENPAFLFRWFTCWNCLSGLLPGDCFSGSDGFKWPSRLGFHGTGESSTWKQKAARSVDELINGKSFRVFFVLGNGHWFFVNARSNSIQLHVRPSFISWFTMWKVWAKKSWIIMVKGYELVI